MPSLENPIHKVIQECNGNPVHTSDTTQIEQVVSIYVTYICVYIEQRQKIMNLSRTDGRGWREEREEGNNVIIIAKNYIKSECNGGLEYRVGDASVCLSQIQTRKLTGPIKEGQNEKGLEKKNQTWFLQHSSHNLNCIHHDPQACVAHRNG